MFDRINNAILYKLESVNWTLATIYWNLIGKRIKP